MEKFIITRDITKKNRLFGLTGRTIEFKIKPVPSTVNPVKWLKDAIQEIIITSTEGLESNDQVGFTFCSQDFKRGEGWIRFRPVHKVTFNDVWDLISSIYQSNSTGLNTETFCLGVTSVNMPTGKGRGRRYNNFEEECRMRKGIVTITNRDTLCLPRSLVVAIAFREKDPQYREIRKDIGKIQETKALELLKMANIEIPEGGCGIPEIQKFQQYLHDFKIVIYEYGYKGRNVIFSGDDADGKTLNLLYHNGHFNVINSLTAAFCCTYFCEECFVPYAQKNEHRCGCRCPGCFQSPKSQDLNRIICKNCNRSFRGQICYENHLASESYDKKYTVCEQLKRCNLCLKTIRGDRNHICGEIFCKTCNKHVPDNHLCFIPVDKGAAQSKDTLFVFYDLETRQESFIETGSLLHEPNLCVFKQYCDNCLENDILLCKRCGIRTHILKDKPIERFTEFILNQRKIFKKIIVLAHNGGGFDHQFILNYLLTKTDLTPNLIMRGTKLILMAVDNIKFLDSLNYFPMRLGQLPSEFGLVQLRKGFFPHLFNKLENQNYVGVMPSVEYYEPDNMKTVERDVFLNWYKEKLNENYVFDFQKEFVEYCKDDVEILSQACLKFRQQLIETTNVCPFTEATTIASACNKVYRRNFLKPNTIGIIPKNGYRWRDNQSKYAIQWLIWEEKQRNINIIHAAKQKEAKIAGVKIDGYCQETKQIFEFHGCYFHGCKHCFPVGRATPLYDTPLETMEHRYEATVSKTERLTNLGYDVIEMWECAFMQLLAENPNIKLCTENNPHLTQVPLNPRDAFYGGRTGNCYEYYKVKAEEKIKYIDVCSLYPWVCKYGKFPVGHPTVYVGEECRNLNLKEIDGLLKCTILPPQNLYHPVLPTKMNDKLMFVLCRTCGNNFNNDECCHTKEERSLSGTWVIDEIRMALQQGYEMVEIHEIWKYEEIAQFDTITKTGGLFTSMMNTFIKIKQEASGWPKNCNTEDEREKYIETFFNMEDVKLEYKNIVENPGLRSLAKLILNSFWGKFGQRENTPKTSIVNKPSDFYKMLVNPSLVINSVLPVNETTVIVNWQHNEESYDALSTVNVVIAAFVTAQARLKLYSYLETLGERVLYYDTDSVIYISRPGEPDIPTGQCIGDMTDELEEFGQGSYITEISKFSTRARVWTDNHSNVSATSTVKIRLDHTLVLPSSKSMMELDFRNRENLAKIFKDILTVEVRDLALSLNMSTVIGLADLAEDEIIPIPLPMKVTLENLKIHLNEDRPPVNITSPGPIPIDLNIINLYITRSEDGVFHILPINLPVGSSLSSIISAQESEPNSAKFNKQLSMDNEELKRRLTAFERVSEENRLLRKSKEETDILRTCLKSSQDEVVRLLAEKKKLLDDIKRLQDQFAPERGRQWSSSKR